MSYRQPARTAARRSRSTVCDPRRRRVLLGVVLALCLVAAASATVGQLLNDKGRVLNVEGRVLNDNQRIYASPVSWPQQGQAAFVLGNGRAAASPHEQSAPIASLAKVMTAYLTLERYPLSGAQDGFTITVTAAQAQAVAQDAQDQSVVAVGAGEQLTERQLLEALLIPSGNNIAQMLATQVAGSQTRFLAEMNAEARALGMDHTTYTDPSGFDPSTVSTAADQLRVFQRAMRFPVLQSLDGQRNAAGCRHTHQLQPPDRRGLRRQDRIGLRGGRVPGLLHTRDDQRPATDRGRRGAGAGAGQRHVGAPHRRGRDRPATGRLRRPGTPRAHETCAWRTWWPRTRRWQPSPAVATRSRSRPGTALMSTRPTTRRRTHA